jgi:hypothetical protein
MHASRQLSERTSPRVSPYGGANADRNQQTDRDLRLDLFRGLSLLFIFIDHIPNNVLSYVTLHSIAFSDAAEVFVFISGYTAAMFYGKALQRQGWLVATAQIYRRVWQLYVAHIVIFIILAAEVSYATLKIHNQIYSGDLGLDSFLNEPHVAVIKTVLLQYQPEFLDILPLYVVLLGAFPLVLLLLEFHRLLPLVLSGTIYLLTLHFGWHPHSYPDNESWYFNPLAWQFLFVIGATAGYSANSRQILPLQNCWFWKLAVLIAVVIVMINISWVIHGAHNAFPGLLLQELSPYVVDKTNLVPLRLLSFIALAVTTVHFVRHNNGLLRCRAAQLIIRCGQHSLQVFCLGILLSVLGRILLTSIHDGILMQLAIDLAGIVLMAGIAGLLTWYNANNPMRSDAAIVGHTNSARRRWSIAGISPTHDLPTAIARIEHHAIAWATGVRRMWGDRTLAAKRLGIHRQLLNSKA